MAHADELAAGNRFAFGNNWSRFLNVLTEERIQVATQTISNMLDMKSLNGMSFLDIGCGSGLFSLAARKLGARVYSFDYDPRSVACAVELKRQYYPNDNNWVIEEGSILDEEYLSRLGNFDIVYSWGVLHHTGHMFQAIENASNRVKAGGKLFIAIYNKGSTSRRWTRIKRLYCRLPNFLKLPFALAVTLSTQLYSFGVHSVRGKIGLFINEIINYRVNRGMSWWHDQIDWIGGYPYENAKPEEIFTFCTGHGFRLERLTTCGGGTGCNEYVFSKIS